MAKKVLGKGLSALLGQPSLGDKEIKEVVNTIIEIDIDKISPNPFQPRTNFNSEHIKELSESIEQLGVVQPITVTILENGKFQLLAGERRLRASKLAGIKTIPAYIRVSDDQEMLEIALVENIHRQDLDAIEIALSYRRLIDECNLTQEEMSQRVSKDRSTITNYLRLLKLDPIIQSGIRDKIISMAHGRALINIEDHNIQMDLYKEIVAKNLSVRKTEELVRNYHHKKVAPTIIPLSEKYKADEKKLSSLLESNVELKVNKAGKGKIIIHFNNDIDLNRIKGILNN
ncbi:ParB/RepB/Spo0J family partition protein [Ichthyobacterium seriolicida]|uniref:Chromosome partitioning protein ParB n=1 Tax=Ichthyobacterium seriolicida TaxID=242600 RepID=A0A1J1E4Q0_9FLAO|nr:ParB/RepB/Spo0J family partition protein [Ichthyobacterium seriolicida]BAV94294.1 chromosome partitioning protein ParB [Ichthyobacterium seriolicida]